MRWLLVSLLFLPVLAAQEVTIFGAGAQSPANNVAQGQSDFVILGFLPLQTSVPVPVNLTSCTIDNVAPAAVRAGAADTANIRLIKDVNMNLTVDASDTVLATVANPTFPLTLTVSPPQSIPLAAATPFPVYLVAVEVAAGATVGNVYRMRFTGATTDFPLTILGFPFDGADQTIVAPSAAEIDVTRLNVSKPRGSTDALGGMQVGTPGTVTWTIHNTGSDPLNFIGALPVYVPTASELNCTTSITQPSVSSIPAFTGSATFSVTITPSTVSQPFAFVLAINNSDSNENPYTMVVSGTGTSGPGTATQLTITTQPGNGVAGSPLAAQPIIAARDNGGQIDSTFTGPVTAAITTGTGTIGAAVIGTATVNAIAGVATFTNVGIDLAGSGYTLTFTSGSLAEVVSALVNITPAPATQLVVTVQPGGGVSGVALATQPVIEARSSGGALDTAFTGGVMASITPATGTAGAQLFGTLTVNAVAGIATFTDLEIDLAGTGYTLTFTSGGLTPAASAAFDVVAAAATQLVIATQPGNGTGGVALAPQPVLEAQNATGQVDIGFVGNVTAAITTGTGTTGAALLGTAVLAVANGVATFSDLAIDLAGTGYTLTFTAAGLISATSSAVDVAVGPAAALLVITQPVGGIAGSALITQPVVAVVDAGGNTIALDNTTQVSAAIVAGTTGAVLSGNSTVTASAGLATFTDLAISLAGNSYQLEFTAPTLMPVNSALFIVATSGSPGPGPGGSGDDGGPSCAAGGGRVAYLFAPLLAALALVRRRTRAMQRGAGV